MAASSTMSRTFARQSPRSRISTIVIGVLKNWASCHPTKPVRLMPCERPPELQNRVQTIRAGTMPRRSILSAAERDSLLALPDTRDDLIRYYTFSDTDLSIIRQHRGSANRLGFAVQLCYLRFPGILLGVDQPPFPPLLRLAADQLRVPAENWNDYGQREQTRREHLVELQTWLAMSMFSAADYRRLVHQLANLAQQTERGIVLAEALIELLRQQRIILPAIDVIERVCSEALTRGRRQVYEALTAPLIDQHRRALDGLLAIREGTKGSRLIWLRPPPGPPKPKQVLAHLEWLKTIREIGRAHV